MDRGHAVEGQGQAGGGGGDGRPGEGGLVAVQGVVRVGPGLTRVHDVETRLNAGGRGGGEPVNVTGQIAGKERP